MGYFILKKYILGACGVIIQKIIVSVDSLSYLAQPYIFIRTNNSTINPINHFLQALLVILNFKSQAKISLFLLKF